ncbi:helix-turn-helix domain-containing protein [Streptomyces alkaliterrae]|uniref:DUF4115 domain-containing protein n=1 Tax=Streptomyces alkaliterrae TaxID=2213162 RepID=A0A5P0YN23_9ACTN|nr:helix-turn-helix domain-containing protein [Streptomyces alkaliterrae]MBB1252574.1 DUF4115 domain-containing protein [Streptomyces alkaliterrae]MBB1258578.1 DUF4115 domain-containing protein [Streptomyces alkaliterrae]MQS00822.1 DUF4115 domain-containing protein [Streptomyces alkaliterrae]
MSIGNSPEDGRPSVGRALKLARIDAGLTVDQVSSATRVRVPIVQAIEQDDFSRCGGDVYARGHVRALARAVGLDAGSLVAQYDADHGGRPEPTSAAPLFEAERIRPEARRPNWTAAMVAAIVAVIGFVGFTMFGGGGDARTTAESGASAEATSGAEKDTKDPKKTEPARTKEPKPEPSDSAIAAAPANRVTVRLVATGGSSWISAEDHTGRLMHEGVLRDGDTRTFTDKEEISLVLGNGGAVELYVNGKKVDRSSAIGQVERLSYTKGDPEQG